MRILITGAAGFIGSALSLLVENDGFEVFGIDNLNTYYNPKLKLDRLKRLKKTTFYETDITDYSSIEKLFKSIQPDIIVNLAAQAGVRYSIENPKAYLDSNMVGFFNILDLSKKYGVKHLIYASSSSVYGASNKMPLNESEKNDSPLNIYAASKKSNELMAYSYSSLFKIQTTGLRFFTVYGPWDRPDMALTKFSQKITSGKSIDVYSNGEHKRDFTFIEDITDGIYKVIKDKTIIKRELAEVFNIGSGRPIELSYFISLIEKNFGIKANKKFLPAQPGDMKDTFADISKIKSLYGWEPKMNIEKGIEKYAHWFQHYHGR